MNRKFGPFEEDFLSYVRENGTVSIKDLEKQFGQEYEYLLKHHKECGYINVDGENVTFISDTY